MSKCLAPTRRILSNFGPLTNQHFGRRIHSQAPFQLNNKQTSCTTTTHKRPTKDNFFPNRSILSRTMSANLSTASSQDEPIKYNIIDKITSNLNPSHLEVRTYYVKSNRLQFFHKSHSICLADATFFKCSL